MAAPDLTAVLDLPVAPAFRAQTIRERRLVRIIQPITGGNLAAAITAAQQVAQAVVTAETTERKADDAALGKRIDDEETRAKGVEGGLRTDLTAERARAEQAELALGGRIDDEEAEREGEDAAIRAQIAGLNVVLRIPGRLYASAVTDDAGYALAVTYPEAATRISGAAYASAATDLSGYAGEVTYPAQDAVLAGRAYGDTVTDRTGYAAAPVYAEANSALPGLAYGDIPTDIAGYARDADLPYPPTQLAGRVYDSAVTDPTGYGLVAYRRVGGTVQDARPLSQFAYQVSHIIMYGQSLSRGLGGVPVLTASVGQNVFRFSGGVRADDGGGTAAQNHADLAGYAETANANNEGETPLGGALACYRQLLIASGHDLPTEDMSLLGSAPGQSGAAIASLSKGTVPYQRLVDDITYGRLRSNGYALTYGMPVMLYAQGESDYIFGTTRSAYKTAFRQLRADVESEVVRTSGNNERVFCISYQVGTHDYYGVPPTIALAQLDLGTIDSEGRGDFAVACPMYIMEYRTDVHLFAAGSKRLGAYFGKALAALRAGKRWTPLYALSASRAATRIVTVRFSVPAPPLVLDTSMITDPNGAKGFEIFDPATGANLPISGVSVFGPDCIRITLGADVRPGCRLRYAYTPPAGYVPFGTGSGNSGATTYGRNVGARGCLRDSDPTVFDPSGMNLKLHNYLLITDMEIF